MSPKAQQRTQHTQDARTIGIISDTHGLLRPEVLTSFNNVDLILHAGDVGEPDVLEHLASVAPVVAVRGNMDYGSWADRLPVTKYLTICDAKLLLIHDIGSLEKQSDLQLYHIVVSGHTHRPLIEEQGNILYVNPGSAGHRRHRHPVSVGKLMLCNGRPEARLIELNRQ